MNGRQGTADRLMPLRGFWVLAAAALMLVAADGTARRPVRGWLVVQSAVEGARIYVDGRLVGKTPLEKPLPLRPGKHVIKATKAGFGTFKADFRIRRGRRTEMFVDLLPVSGLVKVTANMTGAEVYIDGKLAGRTPLIKDVVVGRHKVMVVLEGYNDFTTEIVVAAGKRHFIEAVLTPFEDLAPEVKAIAEQQRQKDQLLEQLDQKLADRPVPPAGQPEAAPSWYQDIWKRWWFWTAAGVVLVTAVAVPVALTAGSTQANLDAHRPAATIQLEMSAP